MTTPNPAGYYGLQLPEAVENEISELDYIELAETLNEMTYSITPHGETYPTFEHLSDKAESYFDDLSVEPRISLIRWIAERLDYLARGTKS
jgi:hypothetical protein